MAPGCSGGMAGGESSLGSAAEGGVMSQPWFACYVNDLLGSLSWRCMTPAQRGAYWQLICCQMQADDGTLPADPGVLSRLAELPLEGEHGIVLEKFPLIGDGKRANPRAYTEWLKRQSISKSRGESGSKGAKSRWQDGDNCDNTPMAIATNSPSTITITSTGTETGTATAGISVQPQAVAPPAPWVPFVEFWEIWVHNRKGKADAEKAWAVLKPDRELFETIKQDLSDRMDRDPTWQKGMVMLPATYIRGRRWNDELLPGAGGGFGNVSNAWKGAEN